MTEDFVSQIGDIVDLDLPGAKLIGKVTGIITRVDHVEYEVRWNDGSVSYVQAWDLKQHEPYRTILDE